MSSRKRCKRCFKTSRRDHPRATMDPAAMGPAVESSGGSAANTIVGESTAQRFQAAAERAAFAGEQASWRMDDASQHLSKLDRNQDRALDLLENINQSEHAATNAVVGNI